VPGTHIEIVRRSFDALNSGELEPVLADVDPDVEFRTVDWVDAEVYVGHDGIRNLYASLREMFDEYRIEPEELIELGDHVVAPVHQTGRGRGSGIEVDVRFCMLYTFEDGRVTRIDNFRETAEALRAAGQAG
jgi:ketosteroid isomerase-like protein